MPLADLVKISDEECEFLFPGIDEAKAAQILMDSYGIGLLIITKAKYGCSAYINGKRYDSYAYDVKTIDTTGAGDSFWAGVLLRLLESGKPAASLSDNEIADMLSFANALGSLVTTKRGAIAAIPSREEIEECMRHTPLLCL
jgi:fructokinase